MKHKLLISVAVAVAAGAMIFPAVSAAQTPKMGGGYKDVMAIPVDDPNVKAIAAALFKPDGRGPFPAVIYMSGSSGLDCLRDGALQKAVIDHFASEGVATLILDPFTPRNEPYGVSEHLNAFEACKYFDRGARDALAAVTALRARSDIDPQRVFL
jgi:dienelactone hydrolase